MWVSAPKWSVDRAEAASGCRHARASSRPPCHPANADDRAEVGRIAKAIQGKTGESVEIAFADKGYTSERPAATAAEHGIALEVIKLPQAKRGFVLLPRRWAVERSLAWATRFRRLAKPSGSTGRRSTTGCCRPRLDQVTKSKKAPLWA